MRIESLDAAVLDILALGAEAEVLDPPDLRAEIAATATRIADLHRDGRKPGLDMPRNDFGAGRDRAARAESWGGPDESGPP